jgi:hypothetical protein
MAGQGVFEQATQDADQKLEKALEALREANVLLDWSMAKNEDTRQIAGFILWITACAFAAGILACLIWTGAA